MGVQRLLVACLLVFGSVAGCAAPQNPPTMDDPDHVGPGPAPQINRPDLPPCTLEAGSIQWPEPLPISKPFVSAVSIQTDAFGVSHVYADDAYSLWFANGYVQARDRLVQMDILRQVGYGTSATYLGAGQLGSDFEVRRTLYTPEELQAQLDAAPPESVAVLQAYSDGVNRFMLEAISQDALPGEFAALGRVPPLWTPVDSAAVIAYLIGFFGVAGGNELANLERVHQLQETVGDAAWNAFGDMVWLQADDTYTTISSQDATFNGCEEPLPSMAAAQQQLAHADAAAGASTFGTPGSGELGLLEPDLGLLSGFKWGSNALLVDGSHTNTGQPIMWGAPQMGYFKPPVPYQIGLHAPSIGYDAAGIGVAGAPGIVIGRNADIAWTATSGIEDQVDLVQVAMSRNGAGERTYEWDGQQRIMDCWISEHQVLPSPGGDLVLPTVYEQEVCRAEGYPVVATNEQSEPNLAWIAKSTTRGEELLGALIWLSVATADSLDSFRDSVQDFPFTFNFHVASKEGVAFMHTGNVPLRAPGYDPRLPTPAGDEFSWRGEAYTQEMGIWATDPSRGYFANWNNAPGYGWRAGDEATLWGPAHRVQQIEYWMQDTLQANGGKMSFEDVARVNWLAATHDSYALAFLPHLIEAAQLLGNEALVRELSAWQASGAPWRDSDNDGFYDDVAHTVWDEFMHRIFAELVHDELGPLTPSPVLEPPQSANNGDHGVYNNGYAHLAKILSGTTKHDWCNGRGCDQIVADVLADIVAELGATGPMRQWRTPVHEAEFLPLGASHPDSRPMINKGSWVQVVSMAEPARSMSVLPPGNSGLITVAELALATAGLGEPPRLTQELDLYWTGQFKPFPLTPSEVDAVTVERQTLVVA